MFYNTTPWIINAFEAEWKYCWWRPAQSWTDWPSTVSSALCSTYAMLRWRLIKQYPSLI